MDEGLYQHKGPQVMNYKSLLNEPVTASHGSEREMVEQWCLDFTGQITDHTCEGYQWDGSVLRSETESGLIHEASHLIVAAKHRKGMECFGLGLEPESRMAGTGVRVLSFRECSAEEEMASLLGILIERSLGMPFQDTLEEHTWIHCNKWENPAHVPVVFAKLIARGLVDNNGHPIIENIKQECQF